VDDAVLVGVVEGLGDGLEEPEDVRGGIGFPISIRAWSVWPSIYCMTMNVKSLSRITS